MQMNEPAICHRDDRPGRRRRRRRDAVFETRSPAAAQRGLKQSVPSLPRNLQITGISPPPGRLPRRVVETFAAINPRPLGRRVATGQSALSSFEARRRGYYVCRPRGKCWPNGRREGGSRRARPITGLMALHPRRVNKGPPQCIFVSVRLLRLPRPTGTPPPSPILPASQRYILPLTINRLSLFSLCQS